MKYTTGALKEHHHRVLETLRLLYKAFDARDAVTLCIFVKFAQGFVDACHHSVEELILFHGAVRGGFPYEGGPIQVMVCEHGVGQFLARRMEELYLAWRSGDEKAFAELLDVARLYADHLAQHIDKENGVLFPMLEANIHEVESGKTVEDVERENRHEEWLKTLEEVKRRLGADGGHTRCSGVRGSPIPREAGVPISLFESAYWTAAYPYDPLLAAVFAPMHVTGVLGRFATERRLLAYGVCEAELAAPLYLSYLTLRPLF